MTVIDANNPPNNPDLPFNKAPNTNESTATALAGTIAPFQS
jgi:hypothetical protein